MPDIWPEFSSIYGVNLVKILLQFQRRSIFLGDCILMHPANFTFVEFYSVKFNKWMHNYRYEAKSGWRNVITQQVNEYWL